MIVVCETKYICILLPDKKFSLKYLYISGNECLSFIKDHNEQY